MFMGGIEVLEYVALLVAFAAGVMGVFGRTTSVEGKVNRRGWWTITVIAVGLLTAVTLQARQDMRETFEEKQRRHLQGVALIQLQEALNDHVGYWRSLTEHGWDPGYFGTSVFELPDFMRSDDWRGQMMGRVPDFPASRSTYQVFRGQSLEILLLYRDVLAPEVIVAASEFRRQPMAEYFLSWPADPKDNPLIDWTFEELRAEFRARPIGEIMSLSETIRDEYSALGLDGEFERSYRGFGQVKEDRH